jgi:hypothetical protein
VKLDERLPIFIPARSALREQVTASTLRSSMVRTAWTDERLDDLANRMDAGFARVDADIRELRAEIGGLRLTLLRVGGGIMIGLVGVIAGVLVSPIGS